MRSRHRHRAAVPRAVHAAFALAVVALLSVAMAALAQGPTPSGASGWSWYGSTGPTGATGATGTWGASWNAPYASFVAEPPLETGRDIALRSTSTHTNGPQHLASYAWDLDNDLAYDDGSAQSATVRYETPGDKEIGLRVTDDAGATSTVRGPIRIGQGSGTPAPDLPVASFTVKGTRRVGKKLTFTSTSSGAIATYAWDLDGDGQFDDATTAQAKTTFATAGDRVVRLRVSDDAGVPATAEQTLTIAKKKKAKKAPKKK